MTQCDMHSDGWDCAAYGYRDDGVHESKKAMPSYLGDLSRMYCERGSPEGREGVRHRNRAQKRHGKQNKAIVSFPLAAPPSSSWLKV